MSTLPPPPPVGGPVPPRPVPFGSPHAGYAGFWRRAGARILDTLLIFVVGIACAIPAIVAVVAGDTEEYPCVVDHDGFEVSDAVVEEFGLVPNATCEELTDGALLIVVGLGLIGVAPFVLFYIWFYRRLGRTGQTPGRAATKIAVVDAKTGLPLGGGRAFGRDLLAWNLSFNVLGLGAFWVIWDRRKQSWHDKILTSVVVRTEPLAEPPDGSPNPLSPRA